MIERSRHGAQLIDGIGVVAVAYDAFLVDQWGVLHDGVQACAGAVTCMRQLVSSGRKVIILSNSGKRARLNADRLRLLGFDESCYTALVTSGELAWTGLHSRSVEPYSSLGRRCLPMLSDADRSIAEGLDIVLVDSVDEAEFILLAGLDEPRWAGRLDQLLMRALERQLPLLCTNPDSLRLVPGSVARGSGALAQRYAELGGTVHYVGKPHPGIYAFCRELLGSIDAQRVLAIGDSPAHDIAGACGAGFDTALVMGGVHRADFAATDDDASRLATLRRLTTGNAEMPDWLLQGLCW
jgi:HAD superfamily hydrolase (TIGR01459 family)